MQQQVNNTIMDPRILWREMTTLHKNELNWICFSAQNKIKQLISYSLFYP